MPPFCKTKKIARGVTKSLDRCITNGLFGAAQDVERSPGCSASSGPTSSVDGAYAGQTRARASVRASAVQRPRATRASRVTDGESWEKEQRADSLILLFQLLASLKLCTSIEIAVSSHSHTTHPLRSTPLAVGLGLFAWALTPASAGPRQQSTVQDRPTNKDRKRQSRKA
jgi:hypothetical protein